MYTYQHYSPSAFKKLILRVIEDMKEADVELTTKNWIKIVTNELNNNYDFVSCTDINISFEESIVFKNKHR